MGQREGASDEMGAFMLNKLGSHLGGFKQRCNMTDLYFFFLLIGGTGAGKKATNIYFLASPCSMRGFSSPTRD